MDWETKMLAEAIEQRLLQNVDVKKLKENDEKELLKFNKNCYKLFMDLRHSKPKELENGKTLWQKLFHNVDIKKLESGDKNEVSKFRKNFYRLYIKWEYNI